MLSEDVVTKAVQHMIAGAIVNEIEVNEHGRGRPKKTYHIKDLVLSSTEYNAVMKRLGSGKEQAIKPVTAEDLMKPMTDDEFEALSRLATPKLIERAYQLAMVSQDAEKVLKVARFMAEYGYGKPKSKIEVAHKSEFIRRGWGEMAVLDVEEIDEYEED